MSELEIVDQSSDILDDRLHNRRGDDGYYSVERTGWYFGAGNPEFWQMQDRLLVPGGKVLDIGIGEGRSSVFFSLHGMDVTGVDPDSRAFGDIAEFGQAVGANINLIGTTLEQTDLPRGSFDTVLLDSTLIHQDSKEAAYDLVRLAYEHVRPGGHLWIRTGGVEDYNVAQIFKAAERGYHQSGMHAEPFNGEVIDEYTVRHECGCSGEWQMDTSVFFEQLELHALMAELQADIVHSQCIPQLDKQNVMFGEDWQGGQDWVYQSGMITILAQKPERE